MNSRTTGRSTLFLAVIAATAAAATPSSAARQTAAIYSYSLVSANLKITNQVAGSYVDGSTYTKRETDVFHGVPRRHTSVGALQVPKRFGILAVPTNGNATWTAAFSSPAFGTKDCSGSSTLPGYGGITAVMKVSGRSVHVLWSIYADGSDPICGLVIVFKNVTDKASWPVAVFRRRTVLLTFKGTDAQTNSLDNGTETQNVEWTGAVKLHNCGLSC